MSKTRFLQQPIATEGIYIAILKHDTNFTTLHSPVTVRWSTSTNFYISLLVLLCRIPAFYQFVRHCYRATQRVFEKKFI